MEPVASSSSSSNFTRANSDLSDGERPKLRPEQSFQLDALDTEAIPTGSRERHFSWSRLDNLLASKYPVFYKLILYAKGPRPKRHLTDPSPILNSTLTFKGKTYTLAVEHTLLRITKPFTSPWLFVLLVAAYIIGFAFFSRAQSFLTPASSFVDCTSTYWLEDDGCGLDGLQCAPFTNSSFDFRCPAQCNSVILQNPRTIGSTVIDFVPLLVGGGDENKTYRGDSFICAAAVHAGAISNSKGGCASLQLVGNYTDYLPLTAHGLSSVGFPSVFPLSFQFLPSTDLTHCTDLRNPALAFNILITCLIFFVLRPKPIVLFWCLVCIGFWHIALFSQPISNPPPIDTAIGTFLPALFVCYAFWRLAFRFTLPAFSKAPIEGAVWYIGPFWVGVLANITFEKIPFSRLTAHDIGQRAGAGTALAIIIVVVFFCVVNQCRVARKTGWLVYYLGWYIAGGLVALVLALLPGLQFRLHHYFAAMVLMPATAFPTRLSAIYQGLLLGLFLNGVAAFGFASILQTAADLQADGPSGSTLASFLTNSTTFNSSVPLAEQAITWNSLPDGWDGFSLLVDDVERYTGPMLNYSLAALQAGIPHFFRLALTSDGYTGDFTMAAILWPNGTWVDPLPGRS